MYVESRSPRSAREPLDGIGFVFAKDDPSVGIDLDGSLDPETDELEPWAAEIVQAARTYCEVSPSGLGVKLIGRGHLPADAPKRLRGELIEMYDSGRYFTISGHVYGGCGS